MNTVQRRDQSEATLLIRGGHVIDPATGMDGVGDVLIVDGKIAEVGGSLNGDGSVLHAAGLIVCPGLVDMHVHLREPGGEHKETLESGTRAALAGGFTTVACMPNTNPPLDNPALVRSVIEKSRAVGGCRVCPIAAITVGRLGRQVVDLEALRSAGAVAFSDDGDGVEDDGVMAEAFSRAAALDVLLIQHCEFKALSRGGVMHLGAVSRRLGVAGIDPAAEERMIERDLDLLRRAGGRYHVAHISTGRAVDLVRRAKAEGLGVTTEVCPHHLLLTDEACASLDPNTKMHPPLRTADDVEACREGVCDGTIDGLVTDHAPHAAEEKARGFVGAPFGIIGLETSVALAAEALVRPGRLTWPQLIRRMSTVPAAILGVAGGSLAPGSAGNVTLIKPDAEWRLVPQNMASRSRNSPFLHRELVGRVAATIYCGKIGYACSEFGLAS